MAKRLREWEKANVPVYDRTGKIVAFVNKLTQSIGAAKAAKVKSCEWTFRYGTPGWVIKEG